MNITRRREKEKEIKTKYASLARHLNERTRRLWAATEAVAIGYGGVYLVSEVVGIDRNTVMAGIREISDGVTAAPTGRIRRVGGGRKPLTKTDSTVAEDLKRLVEPTE